MSTFLSALTWEPLYRRECNAIAPLYYILRQTNRSDQLCTMPTATTTPTTNTTHTLRLPCFTYMCVCVCVCMSACGRVRAHIHCGYRHLSHTHVPHIRGKCNRTKPSNKPHVCCAKVKYTHLFSEQRRRPDWCAYAFLCALHIIAPQCCYHPSAHTTYCTCQRSPEAALCVKCYATYPMHGKSTCQHTHTHARARGAWMCGRQTARNNVRAVRCAHRALRTANGISETDCTRNWAAASWRLKDRIHTHTHSELTATALVVYSSCAAAACAQPAAT